MSFYAFDIVFLSTNLQNLISLLESFSSFFVHLSHNS